jgi:CDP-diacylglycerol pyrophosphatase
MKFSALAGVLALALLAAGCATTPAFAPLPPPSPHPNGQILWGIVHGQCVPDQLQHASPAPCAKVDLAAGEARGYAVLKDRAGVAQQLVMPTALIPGVEDPRLLASSARNYFAEAWAARTYVEARLGRRVPRTMMSVAVNSQYGRSQDLLHLHVDCLSAAARDTLAAAAPRIGRRFSAPITIDGHPYRIRRLDGETLSASPFRLLASEIPGARRQMAAWTLAVVGADFAGRPGFWLLAGHADPEHGEPGAAEFLQDHDCKAVIQP